MALQQQFETFSPVLHSLRGFAAVAVLLFHWEQHFPVGGHWLQQQFPQFPDVARRPDQPPGRVSRQGGCVLVGAAPQSLGAPDAVPTLENNVLLGRRRRLCLLELVRRVPGRLVRDAVVVVHLVLLGVDERGPHRRRLRRRRRRLLVLDERELRRL